MRRSMFLVIVIITLLSSNIIQAQSDGLDPNAHGRFGETSMSEYSWSEWWPDYYTVSVNDRISTSDNVSLSLTDIELDDNCRGYTTQEPFYQVYWFRENSTIIERERLRIFYIGFETDTGLLIHHEDGSWYCNDNAFMNTENPLIDIEFPRTGDYSIWILAPHPGNVVDGTLYFTLADYDPLPQHYNTMLTDMFDYVGQGSSLSGARIIYTSCKITESGATLSADVIVDNMQGYEEVRLQAQANNQFWYSEPIRVLRSGSTSFDYSRSGEGSLQLFMNSARLSAGTLVEVMVQIKPPSEDWQAVAGPFDTICYQN